MWYVKRETVVIQVAILEDEPRYREQVRQYLERFEREEGVQFRIREFTDGDEIVEHYRLGYDLLLMDIELPLLDGMSAAEEIRKKDPNVKIIFITNNPNYAIRGYKVEAMDYVLKPINYFAFSQAVGRALRFLKPGEKHYISVRIRNGVAKVDVSRIRYIDVLDHYLCYHTTDGELTTKASIRDAAEELKEEPFFQCNKAYLVNLAYVDGMQGNDLFVGDDRIPVSRSRKKELLEAINRYMTEKGI